VTDHPPLDLRTLADVESPEVVKSALRRFRRKLFATGAAVLVAGIFLVSAIVWATLDRGVAERIEEAPGAYPGAVYEINGATVVLTKVADLGGTLGLHLLLAAPHAPATDGFFLSTTFSDFDQMSREGVTDAWLEVEPPENRRLEVVIQRDCVRPEASGRCPSSSDPLGRFTIDLNQFALPPDLEE
jgi:hypothetical protein